MLIFQRKYFILMVLICLIPTFALSEDSLKVVVSDFSTKDNHLSYITNTLTEEFEEMLIHLDMCKVLERREFDKLKLFDAFSTSTFLSVFPFTFHTNCASIVIFMCSVDG